MGTTIAIPFKGLRAFLLGSRQGKYIKSELYILSYWNMTCLNFAKIIFIPCQVQIAINQLMQLCQTASACGGFAVKG